MPTPLEHQYLEIKGRYPDAILLFRLGDFYETFGEDAKIAARDLEIVLTHREFGQGHRSPMAGIPFHALENYLGRLVRKGHRVAICEQLSEPKRGRTLVDRDVVRVVTPGTIIEPSLLDQKSNNYLATVAIQANVAAISYLDITTGDFAATQLPLTGLAQELSRLSPSEVVISSQAPEFEKDTGSFNLPVWMTYGIHLTRIDPTLFDIKRAERRLLDLFQADSLAELGCEGHPLATSAAGALIAYLEGTHKSALNFLYQLRIYTTESFMVMDHQTRRNLELFQGNRSGSREQSLIAILDSTQTPMGSRMLRQWLGQPLLDLNELSRRQQAVEWFHDSSVRRQRFQAQLSPVGDMERILHRLGTSVILPRELVSLAESLRQVPELKTLIGESSDLLNWLNDELFPCEKAVLIIQNAIEESPQGEVGQGNVVREGFSEELDQLRLASRDARTYIANLERRERERSGISSLKVGYNRVFGYYLEVTNSNLDRVPDDYTRRQTLVGGERFFTPELKSHEDLILNARDRIEELERELFQQVCDQLIELVSIIGKTAKAIGILDVLISFGEIAVQNGYVKPSLHNEKSINIKSGRHPVVEYHVPVGTYIPNDIRTDNQDQILIITGPNMAGKSTYLRQVALIVLMAQIGSFVPAAEASIGLVDRILTRVGLQDDLAMGQSTFMVEMLETAAILQNATPTSLVILDEIGRGTSTYDGMSIAQAVIEYIHNSPRLQCRTFFATHYHELTSLSDHLSRIRNYNVAVTEENGDVIFLHQIIPGSADRSYGIHVAGLAGLPKPVIERARELLASLELNSDGKFKGKQDKEPSPGDLNQQLSLFASHENREAIEVLLALDLDALSPVEALNKLYYLQKLIKDAQ